MPVITSSYWLAFAPTAATFFLERCLNPARGGVIPNRINKSTVALLAVLLGTVFVLDLGETRGLDIAMVYSTLVLIVGWWLDRKRMLIVASGCVLLIVLSILFPRGDDFDLQVMVMNHLLALVTVGITAGGLWLHRQREENVKRLTGLLPMCALCKKIRDDKGLWSQVEQYFQDHYADLQFTHGMCPACSRQLYPELFPKLSDRQPEAYK